MNKSGNTLNPCLVCFHVSILSSRCCDRESLTTKSRDKLLPWTSLLCSLFLMICWWSKFKRILVQSPLFYRWENWGWEKPVLEIRSSRSSFLRVWPLNQQHLYPGENLLEMQTLRLHSTYRLRICIWTRFPWDLCADSLNLKALFRLECSTHPPTPFFFYLKFVFVGGDMQATEYLIPKAQNKQDLPTWVGDLLRASRNSVLLLGPAFLTPARGRPPVQTEARLWFLDSFMNLMKTLIQLGCQEVELGLRNKCDLKLTLLLPQLGLRTPLASQPLGPGFSEDRKRPRASLPH